MQAYFKNGLHETLPVESHGEGMVNLAGYIPGLFSLFPSFPILARHAWAPRVSTQGGNDESGLGYGCSEVSFVGSQLIFSEVPVLLLFSIFKLPSLFVENMVESDEGNMTEFHKFKLI